jgi:hypothetical protein
VEEKMIKRILVFNLIIFILLFHLCSDTLAESGQKFSVEGYNINVSVDQIGKKISIRGDISGGQNCKNLRLKFRLIDYDGKKASATVVIQNYSVHERFSANAFKCTVGTRWLVSEISIHRSAAVTK